MKTKNLGFSLIELMVVLAIVGVLASIAVPGYRNYLLRSHRAEAKAELLAIAAAQEKFYLQSNTYATNALLDDAPPTGLGRQATTAGGFYTIAIAAGANNRVFSATATATGGQTRDTDCLTFTIDQAGTRTATSANCW